MYGYPSRLPTRRCWHWRPPALSINEGCPADTRHRADVDSRNRERTPWKPNRFPAAAPPPSVTSIPCSTRIAPNKASSYAVWAPATVSDRCCSEPAPAWASTDARHWILSSSTHESHVERVLRTRSNFLTITGKSAGLLVWCSTMQAAAQQIQLSLVSDLYAPARSESSELPKNGEMPGLHQKAGSR